MEGNKIKATVARLESDRNTIEAMWAMIETYVVPYRGNFLRDGVTDEQSVDWKNRDLFDSTAVRSNETLASSIHGALTNPSYQWFELRFRQEELNKNTEAAGWLHDTAKRMFYKIQDSNFNLEIGETYLDITSFGTAFPTLEQEGGGVDTDLVFSNIPLKECFFEIDHRGRILRFFRKIEYTVLQIEEKFGEVPESLQGKDVGTKVSVLYAIYKRDLTPPEGKVVPKKRKYGYKYIVQASGEKLGEEGGYYEMPTYAARWKKTADSVWGNSPSMKAMPDILTLNALVEMILTAAEKAIDPPMKTTERGLMGDLDLQAGGLSVVRSMDDLAPMESKTRFDVSQLTKNDLMTAIEECYHINDLQLKNSPAMTATEVTVRYELMQRLLGPTLGRLQNVLSAILSRVFSIMSREGLLPELPASLEGLGADLDIQFTGPLARAQKSDIVSSTERWLGTISEVGQSFPEVMDYPDLDFIMREQRENLNIPPQYMKSKAAISKIQKERQQAQQDQMKIDQAQGVGDAMQAVGEGQQALGGQSAIPTN